MKKNGTIKGVIILLLAISLIFPTIALIPRNKLHYEGRSPTKTSDLTLSLLFDHSLPISPSLCCYRYEALSEYDSMPGWILGNYDTDSELEIFLMQNDTHRLYVYDPWEANIKLNISIPADYPRQRTVLATGDLTGDKKDEIVAFDSTHNGIYVLDSNGTKVWNDPAWAYTFKINDIYIADIDNDTIDDVLVCTNQGDLVAYRGYDGYELIRKGGITTSRIDVSDAHPTEGVEVLAGGSYGWDLYLLSSSGAELQKLKEYGGNFVGRAGAMALFGNFSDDVFDDIVYSHYSRYSDPTLMGHIVIIDSITGDVIWKFMNMTDASDLMLPSHGNQKSLYVVSSDRIIKFTDFSVNQSLPAFNVTVPYGNLRYESIKDVYLTESNNTIVLTSWNVGTDQFSTITVDPDNGSVIQTFDGEAFIADVSSDGIDDLVLLHGSNFRVYSSDTSLIPSKPENVQSQVGDQYVNLEWDVVSSNVNEYNVYRSTISGTGHTLITKVMENSFNDTTVINDITYYYLVSANNTAGESQNSTEIGATPQIPMIEFKAPVVDLLLPVLMVISVVNIFKRKK